MIEWISPGTCDVSGLHLGDPITQLVSRVVVAHQLVRLLFVICAETCPPPPHVTAARLPGAPPGSPAAQLEASVDTLDPRTLKQRPLRALALRTEGASWMGKQERGNLSRHGSGTS